MPAAGFQKAKRIKVFPVGDDFHQDQEHFSIFKDSTEDEIRPAEGRGSLRANIQKGDIFHAQTAKERKNGLFTMGEDNFGSNIVVHEENLGQGSKGGKA
jgi:hypothetical protein